jgi:murein DD-endopeptidase MepM/ murein hydrolase activator NlpD
MRWLVILLASGAFGQTFEVTPARVKQGEVLRVRGGESARMNSRTIRLFPQTDGATLGLMPVPALEKPGEYAVEFLDKAGAVLHTRQVAVIDAHYAKQNVVLSKAVVELKPAPGENEAASEFRKNVSEMRYWSEPIQLPVPGCMTSPFGVQRYQNGEPTGNFHAGFDQRGAAGTPVHAITGGVVKISKMFTLRGGTVAIDHGQGLESIYMHMSKVVAMEGAQVSGGDVIGYVGATGRVTAPHLHWTLYANGVPVNPAQWVKLQSCYLVPKKRIAKRAKSD